MKQTPNTRYSLIEKLQSPEDAEAWEEFAAIYQPIIFEACLSKGMQYADANDVTQDVLARVAKVIHKFDAGHAQVTFRGWLYRLTRNLVVDFFRHREKDLLAKASLDFDDSLAFPVDCEESRQFDINFRRRMFVMVAKQVQSSSLEKTWTAFWETEIERRPVVEVAEELGISSGAVYVARSRIIARMRKEVQTRLSETTHYQLECGDKS